MSWLVLGLLLALGAHAVVSTLAALGVLAARPLAERALARAAPAARARLLFALCLAPSAAGLVAVVAVVLPAWIAHEPRATNEAAGPLLRAAGLAGAALLAARLGPGLLLAARTARAVAAWTRRGTPVPGLPLPAARFDHPLPVAALVGVVRPRLLLADRLVAALDAPALQAVAAHEMGHAAARDNLRRLLLASSPDVLAWLPQGRRLRRGFDEAAEAAADRHALARVRPETLARALVTAAGLVPEGRRLELPLAALDDGAAPLADRVRSLLAAEPPAADGGSGRGVRPAHALAAGLALAALVVFSAARPEAHALLETVVHALA